jgi:hypothetical protein
MLPLWQQHLPIAAIFVAEISSFVPPSLTSYLNYRSSKRGVKTSGFVKGFG